MTRNGHPSDRKRYPGPSLYCIIEVPPKDKHSNGEGRFSGPQKYLPQTERHKGFSIIWKSLLVAKLSIPSTAFSPRYEVVHVIKPKNLVKYVFMLLYVMIA